MSARDDYQEAYEADWYDALRRAIDLIDEHPSLEPDLIMTALDDEFAGSLILPSGDSDLVKAVRLNHREMNRLAFSDIVRDLDVDRAL